MRQRQIGIQLDGLAQRLFGLLPVVAAFVGVLGDQPEASAELGPRRRESRSSSIDCRYKLRATNQPAGKCGLLLAGRKNPYPRGPWGTFFGRGRGTAAGMGT